jgi:sugar-phosphatase
MHLNTVIFDMDGLLIDSEPLWKEAGEETLANYGIQLTEEQYHSSTGLRTPEWIDHWFSYFRIDKRYAPQSIVAIENSALAKIQEKGIAMPGVDYIFPLLEKKAFRIGLASSSPMRLIEVVVKKLKIESYLHAITSAESLPFGKPHPQVFIECAQSLNAHPSQCLVFEDSFNGMIAAKAAKMRCVVIPPDTLHEGGQWGAADLKLRSLADFNEEMLLRLI